MADTTHAAFWILAVSTSTGYERKRTNVITVGVKAILELEINSSYPYIYEFDKINLDESTFSGFPAGITFDQNPSSAFYKCFVGTPTTVGTYQPKITANGRSHSFEDLIVKSNLSVSTATLPYGVNGNSYSTTVSASGSGTITWTASGLPSGLSINSSGKISGTPTASGSFNVTVTAKDSYSTASKTLSLVVYEKPNITTSSLSYGVNGVAYSLQCSATGTATITWSASNLPSGLSCNSSGKISGTPNKTESKSVTITAKNSYGTASKTLELTIYQKPAVTTTTLPAGINGVAYSTQLAASGSATITYSASNLPTGLSCSTAGKISGTPTVTGTRSVTITVKNSYGTATKSLNLVINQKPAISTSSLPAGINGVAYSTTLTATGTTPYTWKASNLPSGLSINTSSGVISGTPNKTETKTATITVSNVAGNASKNLSLVINEKPSITTSSITSGINGVAYNFTISATGTSPYTWSATNLPSGLEINTSTGVISGTPSKTETKTAKITIQNVAGSVSKNFSIVINEKPVITTESFNMTVQNIYYYVTNTATGTKPYTWSAKNLPSGLSINSSTGIISGTPLVSGDFIIRINVKNVAGSYDKDLSLSIIKLPDAIQIHPLIKEQSTFTFNLSEYVPSEILKRISISNAKDPSNNIIDIVYSNGIAKTIELPKFLDYVYSVTYADSKTYTVDISAVLFNNISSDFLPNSNTVDICRQLRIEAAFLLKKIRDYEGLLKNR